MLRRSTILLVLIASMGCGETPRGHRDDAPPAAPDRARPEAAPATKIPMH